MNFFFCKPTMRLFILILSIFISTTVSVAQIKLQVLQDSIRILNSELIIRNQSKGTQGVLYNKGNGLTEFRSLKFIRTGDSALMILGQDTTSITAGAGGGGYVYDGDPDISLSAALQDATHMKLKWWRSNADLYESARIGVIGDSQGKGDYTSSYNYSIVGRLQRFIYAATNNAAVTNYCGNGYNSRNVAPNGSNAYVDNQRNITKALADGNKIIILCNTSNDFYSGAAGGVATIAEAMSNTLKIADACEQAGATLFVISSIPRTTLSTPMRDSLRMMAGLLNQKFRNRCAYVYQLLEDPASPTSLNPNFAIADNIHLNDGGANIVFSAVRDLLTSYFVSNTNVARYQLQRKSTYNGNFSDFQFPAEPNNPSAVVTPDSNYYRVRIVYNNGYYSKWSNTVQGLLAHQDSVYNQPPVVTVSAPQIILLPTSSATVSVSASDPNSGGSIASYNWFRIMGVSATITTPNAASTTITGLAEGSYVFRCQVTNSSGLSSFADAFITVRMGDSTTAATRFNFNLSAQSENGWIDVSGGPLLAANNGKTWTDNLHNITLTNLTNSTAVWGTEFYSNAGNTNGESTADVGGYAAPSAVIHSGWYSNNKYYIDASSNQLKLSGLSPAKVYKLKFYCSLESSLGLDADPTVVVVNNNLLNQKQVNAVGNTSKVLIFRGIVPSSSGEVPLFVGVPQGSAQYGMLNGLTVEEDSLIGSNQVPEVVAGSNKTVTLPLSSSSVSVTASDADGALLSIVWTQVSGPSTAIIATPNSMSTAVSSLQQGVYVFRCTATDNYGGSSHADVQVTVNAASADPMLYVGGSLGAYTQSGWKVLSGTPHLSVLSNTATIASNTVTISTVSTDNWSTFFGGTADSTGEVNDDGNGFVAPLRVQKGSFYNTNTYNAAKPQITISNLPAGTYTVRMFGSLLQSLANALNLNCTTQFRVNGGTPVEINTAGNTSQQAVFTSITVSEGGTIELFFNPVVGGSTSYVGMLSFFTLQKTN